MLTAVKAIYEDGKIKLLEKGLKGKHEVIVVFLERLRDEDIADTLIVKYLGIEQDYDDALKGIEERRHVSPSNMKNRLRRKIDGKV